ncbi:MAG: hypothetical protein NXI16_00800 [Alphaproteobacteria bacterium]|nr:hypothetical protein [Alphaproteobacteria bacterium]
MGSFFPTRLSFMRTLIRRLQAEGSAVERPVWNIGPEGYGHAVYSVPLGGRVYSLIAYADPLPDDARTDRVIAEAWDSTYVLFDGVPTAEDIDRLRDHVPRQEAGRYLPTELILSRANKSVRLFDHVVERLAQGRQPDGDKVAETGYLLRTTAVYGNGKFGIADRERIAGRPGLAGSFQAEMLTVWLIRGFSLDLVEHIAAARGGDTAVPLAPRYRRHFGIGNSTGLGMAPFLINHPVLINNWMEARETAYARVRGQAGTDPERIDRFLNLHGRARLHIGEWFTTDPRQRVRIGLLHSELGDLTDVLTPAWFDAPFPWQRLHEHCVALSEECQELILALMLEPHGDLIDDLADRMSETARPAFDPTVSASDMIGMLKDRFRWSLGIDFARPPAQQLFWYVSEEKLEPRLGDRFREAGAEKELALDIARQAQALYRTLESWPPDTFLAEILMAHPEHRHIARRVQATRSCPYAEIQDNLIGADCLPIDLLRCKLSFFGASKFDPKSDRWTRITLYQGAPGFDEVDREDADDWAFPILGSEPCTAP